MSRTVKEVGGGAAGIRADIPLQLVVKTVVEQVFPCRVCRSLVWSEVRPKKVRRKGVLRMALSAGVVVCFVFQEKTMTDKKSLDAYISFEEGRISYMILSLLISNVISGLNRWELKMSNETND